MHKNGNISNIYLEDEVYMDDVQINKNKKAGWDIYFIINAIDKEHAIKIANERRVQLIANGEL